MNQLFQTLQANLPNLPIPYDIKSFFALRIKETVAETDEQIGERYLLEATQLLEAINSDFFIEGKEIKIENARKLLEDSVSKGNPYARCLQWILQKNDAFRQPRIIQRNKKITILGQESYNWFILSIFSKADPSGMDVLIKGSESGNKYAKGELGRILLEKGDNIENALHLLVESHFSGYIKSTHILAEYYYKKGDDKYKGFLEIGCKLVNADSIFLKADILWEQGDTKTSLDLLRVLAFQLGYKKAIDRLMIFSQDTVEREKLFSEFIISCKETIPQCFDYDKIEENEKGEVSENPVSDIVYKHELINILSRIETLYGKGIKLPGIDKILSHLYFQRSLQSSYSKRVIGIYHPTTKKIGIDAYIHISATYFRNIPLVTPLPSILTHELVHKISRENSQKFILPRFLDEGITSLIEEEITGIPSLGYPQEKRIVSKLLDFFAGERKTVFKNFLSGNTWVLESLMKEHIGKLLEFFSNEDGYKEIVEEMKKHQ